MATLCFRCLIAPRSAGARSTSICDASGSTSARAMEPTSPGNRLLASKRPHVRFCGESRVSTSSCAASGFAMRRTWPSTARREFEGDHGVDRGLLLRVDELQWGDVRRQGPDRPPLRLSDNGQLGFGAARRPRPALQRVPRRNNNVKGFNRGWEAGGNKLVLLPECRDREVPVRQQSRATASGSISATRTASCATA